MIMMKDKQREIKLGDTIYFIAGYGTSHYSKVTSITRTKNGLSYGVENSYEQFNECEVYKDIEKFKEFLIQKERDDFKKKQDWFKWRLDNIINDEHISPLPKSSII